MSSCVLLLKPCYTTQRDLFFRCGFIETSRTREETTATSFGSLREDGQRKLNPQPEMRAAEKQPHSPTQGPGVQARLAWVTSRSRDKGGF